MVVRKRVTGNPHPGTDPRADGHRRKADVSREQVLLAAAKLMRKQGYSATTLRQIADAVGIKSGSIYYHFSSKEEILDAVLNLGITTVHEAVEREVEALGPSAPVRARLETAIRAHLGALFEHGDYASVNMRIYGLLPDDIRLRNMRRREAYAAYWDGLFGQAVAAGLIPGDLNPRVIRLILIGALNWTVEWFDPAKGPIGAIAETFSRMLFEGLLTGRGEGYATAAALPPPTTGAGARGARRGADGAAGAGRATKPSAGSRGATRRPRT